MNFDNILDTKSNKPSVPTINQLANSTSGNSSPFNNGPIGLMGLPLSPKVAPTNNVYDQFGSLSPKCEYSFLEISFNP